MCSITETYWMRINKKVVFRMIKLLSSSLLVTPLIACNSVSTGQLPPGTIVSISPEEINWKIANTNGVCTYDPTYYQDHTISIMVLNDSGSYIPDAPLRITLDLSANTFSGTPVMALYDDINKNGVVDGVNELVTDTDSGIFETHTDDKSGSKYVILRVNLSCPYTGTLSAFADGFMGSLRITVEEDL